MHLPGCSKANVALSALVSIASYPQHEQSLVVQLQGSMNITAVLHQNFTTGDGAQEENSPI